MNTQTIRGILVGLVGALAMGVSGCDCNRGTDSGVMGTDATNTDAANTDAANNTDAASLDSGTTMAPTLRVYASTHMLTGGVQIDRMGRPGINTVLVSGPMHDAYNQDADPTMWNANWSATFLAGLAAADMVNGTTGDRLLDLLMAPDAVIAPILADDRLIINTGIAMCGEYLSVELVALMASMGHCGGRVLATDVIDVSLAALVAAGLTDNVGMNDNAFLADWPFLAAAN